jgi:hypothetical protein
MSELVSITRPPGPPESRPPVVEEKFPSEVISLPTKGWFYPVGHPLSLGTLELKAMTAKEEDILTSKNLIQKGVVLDKLLESLIVNKTINAEEMFNCDRNAAFLAIRRMAYGDEYKATITCPRCAVENAVVIDLGKMDNKSFEFEKFPKGKNEFEFQMPNSKKYITYKLLTQKDENAIEGELKALSKINKEIAPEVTTRLKVVIIAVEGNPDKALIRKFVDDLRSIDSLEFRKHLREFTPNIDMSFDFKCSSCGAERREDVPLTVSFFWPNG